MNYFEKNGHVSTVQTQGYLPISKAKGEAILADKAREYLKQYANCPWYYHVETVSKTGMSRRIRVFVANHDLIEVTNSVARALHMTNDDSNGIKVTGCGMDMRFHLHGNIEYALKEKLDYNYF
jgi:hypothetical protein